MDAGAQTPAEAARAAALRAQHAHERRDAAAAREAELIAAGRGDDLPLPAAARVDQAARAAQRSLARAIEAHWRAAEAHEEAAQVHDHAAVLAESRGDTAGAAAHRAAAVSGREAARRAAQAARDAAADHPTR